MYRPDTCAYCQTDTWCEQRSNGKPQCRPCKFVAFYDNLLYRPIGMKLIGWQREVVRAAAETRSSDGRRLYRRMHVSTPKKNGKTALIGGMPISHLLLDAEATPEAYGCAAAKDQAGLVFKSAKRLVEASPYLREQLKVIDSKKRIVRKDGAGFYQVLSADGDVQDGIEPSLLIRDELHRWKGAKAETLLDVTTKGQISRDEPLDIAITTAGAEYESPLWWREYQLAKKVKEGSIQIADMYVAIWEADAKRLETEPEYWKTRQARVLANPSHEDNGGFLKDDAIVREMEKAILQPSERSKYFRYHLNIPVKQAEDPIIDMARWQDQEGVTDVDLREWPIFDVDLLIRKWGLVGKRCFLGIDASWTTDMTAAVFGFPDGDQWTLLPFFWVPKERLRDIERVCMVPLSHWVDQGFVTATEGNAIDLRSVKERIRWGWEMFDCQLLSYDRCNFRTEAMELLDEGIEVKEVPQSFMHLSEPTKFLLSSYQDQKLRHGNNPVYNWHASCLQLQYDRKDNCQPSKPERMKSAKRIDGLQATVTMLAEGRVAEESTMSYTGLRSLNA